MDKNSLIEQQMNSFVKLFNEIPKTITFVRDKWHGPHGSLAGLVTDPDFRLIMQPGELAKAIDNYKRRIVLIGTAFGLIAIYPTIVQASRDGVPTLSYFITESLATAIQRCNGTKPPVTAKLADHPELDFLDMERLKSFIEVAINHYHERHMHVSDGMKKPIQRRPHRPRPPGQKKPAAAADKPVQKKKHPPRQKQATKPNQQEPKATPAEEVKPLEVAVENENYHPAMAA